MDTYAVEHLDRTSFDDTMIVGTHGVDMPWYADVTLQDPKSFHVRNLMDGIVPFARLQDAHCETIQRPEPGFGPGSISLNEDIGLMEESEAPITSWTEILSPPIKAEDDAGPLAMPGSCLASSHFPDTEANEEPKIPSVGVDVLMKAIQSKHQVERRHPQSPVSLNPARHDPNARPHSYSDSSSPESRRSRKKIIYPCQVPSCRKIFSQRGRLNVHTRAHTGDKPYRCRAAGCGQHFSQMGNLKTHERRHNGERPFQCNLCNRSFAQSGNMRAHRVVHQKVKPYHCKLEDCDKRFTQLGNLKSHQNKFHANVLRDLTCRFASLQGGDIVSAADKELWEYFSGLYKHSNQGIKGRGRDRRISIDNEGCSDLKEEEDQKGGPWQE